MSRRSGAYSLSSLGTSISKRVTATPSLLDVAGRHLLDELVGQAPLGLLEIDFGPGPVGEEVEGEALLLILGNLEPLPPRVVLDEAGPAHPALQGDHQWVGIDGEDAGDVRIATEAGEGPGRLDGPVLEEFHELHLVDEGAVSAARIGDGSDWHR